MGDAGGDAGDRIAGDLDRNQDGEDQPEVAAHEPVATGEGAAPAMVFDLGVYLTVVGASLLALTSIGRLDREGAGAAGP